MTALLSAADLTAMRATQVSSMADTCVHSQRSATQDAYGQPVESWTDKLTYACGLNVKSGREWRRPESTDVITDGQMRLPLSALGVIVATDRVRVTHRQGAALTVAVVYEIEGEPRLGPTCLVADLRRVT